MAKVNNNPGGRIVPAILGSFIVSSLMFWGMHFLIQGHYAGMQKADTLPTIDFVRLKRQSELQTIERRKPPPPPPPPKTPPDRKSVV
jgi:protein TonB